MVRVMVRVKSKCRNLFRLFNGHFKLILRLRNGHSTVIQRLFFFSLFKGCFTDLFFKVNNEFFVLFRVLNLFVQS